jgi:hypothetical protein
MPDLDRPMPHFHGLVMATHDGVARLLCEHLEQTVSIATNSRRGLALPAFARAQPADHDVTDLLQAPSSPRCSRLGRIRGVVTNDESVGEPKVDAVDSSAVILNRSTRADAVRPTAPPRLTTVASGVGTRQNLRSHQIRAIRLDLSRPGGSEQARSDNNANEEVPTLNAG